MVFRVLLVSLLLTFPALAQEVGGVKIAPSARVGDAELVLNGAGLRKRAFFNVYAIGLYLPEKKAQSDAVLAAAGPKRVAIHMLRDVGAGQFSDALADGLRQNHPEDEVRALEPRVRELAAIIEAVKEAKKGMSIALDWTGSATQVLINGKAAGNSIAGEDFYRALLRIWLGPRPVQDDIKKGLLGG
jgi:hypothetical protein